MVQGSEEAVRFRLWPRVAIGGPLLVGYLMTLSGVTRSASGRGELRLAGHDRFGAPYDDYTRRVRRWL